MEMQRQSDDSGEKQPLIQKTRSTLQNRYRLPFYFFCLAILCIVVFALHSIAPHIERGRRNRGHLPDLYDATISDLQTGLSAGHFTSVDLVAAYEKRAKDVRHLNAIIQWSPHARRDALQLDAERRAGRIRGPLHGIPLLVKDNIGTKHLNTTAGSYALMNANQPDAEAVKKLRKAGAIILAKANMMEWAAFRAPACLPSGWSPVGGLATSPFYTNGAPQGSSGGTAIGVSIGLAPAGLGTSTGGSVEAPSSQNNIVGMRPTMGIVSQDGVVPVTHRSDTIGPMTKTVSDAASLLTAMAETGEDYTTHLHRWALRGVRIGIARNTPWKFEDYTSRNAFEAETVAILRELGATVVEANMTRMNEYYELDPTPIWATDFKADMRNYLAKLEHTPSGVSSVADLLTFAQAHPDLERPPTFENLDFQLRANASGSALAEDHLRRAAHLQNTARQMIDEALIANNVAALIFPSPFPRASAYAGYPLVTVPSKFLSDFFQPHKSQEEMHHPVQVYDVYPNIPFGLSFAGTAGSDTMLLGYAYAYEQVTQVWKERRTYRNARPKSQL